jgi:hypothetical protein
MTNQITILAIELVMATILAMVLVRKIGLYRPQYLRSVGWHGEKKKR